MEQQIPLTSPDLSSTQVLCRSRLASGPHREAVSPGLSSREADLDQRQEGQRPSHDFTEPGHPGRDMDPLRRLMAPSQILPPTGPSPLAVSKATAASRVCFHHWLLPECASTTGCFPTVRILRKLACSVDRRSWHRSHCDAGIITVSQEARCRCSGEIQLSSMVLWSTHHTFHGMTSNIKRHDFIHHMS